jgi:8-oxo-(d)GTP phosphatase
MRRMGESPVLARVAWDDGAQECLHSHDVVILVRQAHAGCKGNWNGDDALRPLTEWGVIQAASLVRSLSDEGVSFVWSSPSVRCRQPDEPLAAARGIARRR